MNNISPLRYPGGKTKASTILHQILIQKYNINSFDNIISPFFGGGSFEFFLQNKYNINIIANDIFLPLYNFWFSCKFYKFDLCSKLYPLIDNINKNKFLYFKNNIYYQNNYINSAYMYFIINRCSFSGSTLSGGYSYESSKNRFTKSSIDKINNLDLSNFIIHNYDFQDFLDIYDSDNNFIFLDPPYYLDNNKLYGNNGDLHQNFDHIKLFNNLLFKNNWMMTYNNCKFIKELYNNYHIIETNWNYGMNKSKKSSELIIFG